MQRHTTYAYAQVAAPSTHSTHRYSGTSSAFSASANPNEDWTKISDLAERRRIQNRIAQRNYRKKLKKRLEDLERRAASNSASPEQRPAELDHSSPYREDAPGMEVTSSIEYADQSRRTPELAHHHYQSSQEDRGMFAHQYTRQLSTSPPPFSYSTYPSTETSAYAPYPQHGSFYTTSAELPVLTSYLPPLSNAYPGSLPSMAPIGKQEYYTDDEVSPFSMSYATMAGIDIPAANAYQDSNPHTPPLSESFEHSNAGSPPESSHYPTTPVSMPGTPPLHLL